MSHPLLSYKNRSRLRTSVSENYPIILHSGVYEMAAASVKVTVGGAEYIPRMANIIALAFQKDPINRYFVLTEGDLPNDAVVPHETRVQATQGRLEKRIVVKPELVEAGDWAAGAVW